MKGRRGRNEYKVVIIGDINVGKTSLLLRFVDGTFSETECTSGVDIKYITLDIENSPYKLDIWDTAGHERFRTITSSYYVGAKGIAIVYDVTNQQSFWNVKQWIEETNNYIKDHNNVAKVLVGNKVDDKESKKISFEEGKQLADQYHVPFLEVSAKTDENVSQIFTTITKMLIQLDKKEPEPEIYVNIAQPTPASNKSCCNK